MQYVDQMGNLASVLGLILSIITLILTGTVKSQIKKIVKRQMDEQEIEENRDKFIRELDELLTYAKTKDYTKLREMDSYSIINEIVLCYLNNWSTLNLYNKWTESCVNKYRLTIKWNRIQKIYGDDIRSEEMKNKKLRDYIAFVQLLKSIIKRR